MTFTLWFMGRPASGKSTLANHIFTELQEKGLPVENLDGDEIRKNLHPDLGFTREDRATNNRRTAFICKLLNRNGIAAVTGMITPFREAQEQARDIVEPDGRFILVYVKCSLKECERRDPKNLYTQARDGKIENFTGVSHPFQEPHQPDIVVDTEQNSVEENLEHIHGRLTELNVISEEAEGNYGLEMSREEEKEIKTRLEELGYLGRETTDDT